MADEFIKGLAVFTTGLLGWLVFSGWYGTDSFESSTQLIGQVPSDPDLYGTLALTLRGALLAFALLGALTFWVLIPAGRQARAVWADRRSN